MHRPQDEGPLDETFVDGHEVEHTVGRATVHVAVHDAQRRREFLDMRERLGGPDLPEGAPPGSEHGLRHPGAGG